MNTAEVVDNTNMMLQSGYGKRMLEFMEANTDGPTITIPIKWLADEPYTALSAEYVAMVFRMAQLKNHLDAYMQTAALELTLAAHRKNGQQHAATASVSKSTER